MDQLFPVAAQTGVFGIAFVVVYWLFRQQVKFLEKQVEMWQAMANRAGAAAERGTEVAAQLVAPLKRKVTEEDRLRNLENAIAILIRRADDEEDKS